MGFEHTTLCMHNKGGALHIISAETSERHTLTFETNHRLLDHHYSKRLPQICTRNSPLFNAKFGQIMPPGCSVSDLIMRMNVWGWSRVTQFLVWEGGNKISFIHGEISLFRGYVLVAPLHSLRDTYLHTRAMRTHDHMLHVQTTIS